MDENTVRLLDLFGAYQPEEEIKALLDDVKVFDAEINMERRQVAVTVHLGEYLPLGTVRKIEQGIAGAYAIRQMELRPVYEPSALSALCYTDVGLYLSGLFAPSMSILAGCKYALQGDTLTITLKGGGKEMLAPYLGRTERWLSEMFGTAVKVEVQQGSGGDAAALFAATERLRRKTVEGFPQQAAAAPEKRRVAAPASNLIYGKAIRGDITPMREIQMDSGRVVVEGEVFAINHRELTKAKAWVISFDITDYGGAVRVNQYMENAKAQPLLEGISKGMWVKVQGKIAFSRFENDIGLQHRHHPYCLDSQHDRH